MRQRVAFARTLFCYLLATCAFINLRWFLPELTHDVFFYSAKEAVLFVLKTLVAVEIWQCVFATFPRARVRVGLLLVVTLVCAAVAMQVVPLMAYPYYLLVGIIHPRQQAGTLLLYAVVAGSAWW